MTHRHRILLLGLLAMAMAVPAIAAPAMAVARTRATVAPPGDSGVSQYLEVVPSAQGGSPPHPGAGSGGGGGTTGGQGGALTASQQRRLNALGPDGRTLAAVVEATAPQTLGVQVDRPSTAQPAGGVGGSTGSAGAASSPSAGLAPAAKLPPVSGASPASLIFDAAAGRGGGGVGVLLPAFMLASLVGVALVVVRRRRTAS